MRVSHSISDELDKKRREEFKKREMRDELERRKALEKLTPEQREQMEREFRAEQSNLKNHPKMHEPGHKANLEEVWEEQDHLDKDQFNPKTFFYLHDTNTDGQLGEFLLFMCCKTSERSFKLERTLLA